MTDAILEHPREAMRATDPDEAIGRNVKRLRVKCGRTIDDVVKAMQKAGYRWNATTQSNIERGARPLRASEVLPLLRCMGYDSDAEEHIMQVYATPTRNKLDDLAGEKSEAVEQAVDNAGGFDLDERRKARAPKSIPDRRPWFFKTVMGRGLVCLLTKVIPILLPVVWFSLVVMGMLPNPLALFDFSTDPQPSLLNPANGCFWLLLVMFIVVVLHDSLPALLRRLGWMMDKPKTASASLTSMVESHYGVSNLEVDWFGAAAGGVPPFDGLYSCRYDTGRRRNNGVLRVRNHRVWLYGPDGCEEERHGH